MNEKEIVKLIENAESMEEVWKAASKAGIDRASFDAMVDSIEKNQGEEMNDSDLEKVNGGILLGLIGNIALAYAVLKKVKQIRKKRYQTGYDEEIMSDNRLGGVCENRK